MCVWVCVLWVCMDCEVYVCEWSMYGCVVCEYVSVVYMCEWCMCMGVYGARCMCEWRVCVVYVCEWHIMSGVLCVWSVWCMSK